MTVRQVLITDVLLRDGVQIEPVTIPTGYKIRLARGLIEAGLTSLEVGSFVRPSAVPQLADTADVLAGLRGANAARHVLVFTPSGARRAAAAGASHARLVLSASDGHSQANAGAPTEAALERLVAAAGILSTHGIRLEASLATAFVCPYDGRTPPARAADLAARLHRAGAEVVHLADTIGAASPLHIRRTVRAVRDATAVPLGLHLHNTYGMAPANVWEALSLGINRFDASLGGIGGCPFAPGAAGNIGTDDLVHLLHHAGIATGIDPDQLSTVRDELRTILGRPLDSALSAVPAVPTGLCGQNSP
jgi:hydroxymethylglutaryl-CoA lyase